MGSSWQLLGTGSCSQLFQRSQASCSAQPRAGLPPAAPISSYISGSPGLGIGAPGSLCTHPGRASTPAPALGAHTPIDTPMFAPPSPGSFPLKLEEHNLPAEPRRGSYTACHSHITL